MKITKRQLIRIIREEKARLVKESVADMIDFEDLIFAGVGDIVEKYNWSMGEELFDEDPEIFAGRSTREEWITQVESAVLDLEEELVQAIRGVISKNEMRLHDGHYHPGNR